MPYAKSRDINSYYEIHGEGEPLVFIMGMASTTDSWGPQVEVFSRSYKLLVFDNRGAGQTDAPDTPYSVEMFADDVAGLMDAVGIDRAHIRGVSAGGLIAQFFAVRHPERVISLILQGATCGRRHGRMSAEALNPFVENTASQEERTEELIRLTVTDDFIAAHPGVVQ